MNVIKSLRILLLGSTLVGCTSGVPSGGGLHLSADGSIHPDATARIANYTGQGSFAEGWAGNSDGAGGPSQEQPLASDRTAR
jgi:hypothetical protein